MYAFARLIQVDPWADETTRHERYAALAAHLDLPKGFNPTCEDGLPIEQWATLTYTGGSNAFLLSSKTLFKMMLDTDQDAAHRAVQAAINPIVAGETRPANELKKAAHNAASVAHDAMVRLEKAQRASEFAWKAPPRMYGRPLSAPYPPEEQQRLKAAYEVAKEEAKEEAKSTAATRDALFAAECKALARDYLANELAGKGGGADALSMLGNIPNTEPTVRAALIAAWMAA